MNGEYKRFKSNSYRRLVDLYTQKWYTQVNEYSRTNYRILKNEFGFEKYLTGLSSCKLKYDLRKFDTGSFRTNLYDTYRLDSAYLICNENINAHEFNYLLNAKVLRLLEKNSYPCTFGKIPI